MALGDGVVVLIDAGAGKVREEEMRVNSAGGKISVGRLAGSFTIEEQTRTGRPLRRILVSEARLVAIIEKPSR